MRQSGGYCFGGNNVDTGYMSPELVTIFFRTFILDLLSHLTRTTIVVRYAGCARSRYTLKLSLIFLMNQSIN